MWSESWCLMMLSAIVAELVWRNRLQNTDTESAAFEKVGCLVLTTLLFSRLHYESFVSLFESQVVKGNTLHIQFSGMLFQKFRESSALLPSAAYYSYKIQLTTTGFYFCSTACSHCTQYTVVHHIIVFNWFSQAARTEALHTVY